MAILTVFYCREFLVAWAIMVSVSVSFLWLPRLDGINMLSALFVYKENEIFFCETFSGTFSTLIVGFLGNRFV